MTTIYAKAQDQVLIATILPKVACNSKKSVKLHVNFDDTWDEYPAKQAVFTTSNDPTPYTETLSVNGECTVPHEVLADEGRLLIYVKGINANTGAEKPTTPISYKILPGTPSLVVSDPSPSIYQKLLTACAESEARISNIIAHNNDTEGNTELIDIRMGADGVTYDSAGASVREQFGFATKAMQLSGVFTDVKYTTEDGDGDEKVTLSGMIDVNGVQQGTSTFRCTDFIELHHSEIEINLIGYTSTCSIAYYDASKTFISGLVGSASYEIQKGSQTVPSNAKYVRFTFLASDSTLYAKIRSYPTDERLEKLEILTSEMKVTDERNYDVIKNTAVANAYIDLDGSVAGTSSWYVSDFIRITKATKIDYSLRASEYNQIIAYYDKDRKYLDGISGESIGLFEATGVTPPDDAVFIRFSAQVDYPKQYIRLYHSAIESNFCEIQRLVEASPLFGKKLVATGDSITATTIHRPYASYAKMIADKNDMKYECNAIWGATLPSHVQSSGSILATIENMSEDADYIILSGGANDWYYLSSGTETLGEISDGYTADIDKSTFYGALECLCKIAIEKWAGKKIIYVITPKLLDVGEARIELINEYVNGMITIFDKWGIPYVDLYHGIPSLFLPALKNLYTTMGDAAYYGTGDGLHPNEEGYRYYYVPKVESLLKTI